tara:strand:+ start:2622 stop:2855 length:234 start_codon:yes stop_codon:yes gene_type:complete
MWRFNKYEIKQHNKLVIIWNFYIVLDNYDCLGGDWVWRESNVAGGSTNVDFDIVASEFKNGAWYISKRSGFARDGYG